MEPFHRKTLLFGLLLTAVLLGGCRTNDSDFRPHVTRLYLEESNHLPASHIMDMVLPISGSHITVQSRPVYAEWDIAQAAQFETEFGPAIILLLNSQAAKDFYRTSITNQGRRLVLTINGVPLGAHYIDRPIEDGRVAFFLELPDEDLPEVVKAIQQTSLEVQKRSQKSGW